MNEPILIIQLQRLGDLVLTFPLILNLHKLYPAHPVWVAAEPQFFQALMPFAPRATFFPPDHLPVLAQEQYKAVYNFSSRPEAAAAAAKARAESRFGMLGESGAMRIAGFWQLYRASLTKNNRHNTFHWADLNCMDGCWPLPLHPSPIKKRSESGRIGLFIGASEPAKMPDSAFWAATARGLLKRGFKPILLGGPREVGAGREIARQCGLGSANFCGRTSLAQLAAIMQSLDLCISPDTGPMHLANWLGTPTLNLSMGNVNARETGPANPGQWVVCANMSCYGCWACSRPKMYCRQAFAPGAIVRLASALVRGDEPGDLTRLLPPGLRLFRTSLDPGRGLLRLAAPGQAGDGLEDTLDQFWREAFLSFAGNRNENLAAAAKNLLESFPRIGERMRASFGDMLAALSLALKRGRLLPDDFWQRQPAHSGLYAGFVQMRLQNADFSRQALALELENLARMVEIFARQ